MSRTTQQLTPGEQNDIHGATLDRTGFWGRKAAGCLFLSTYTHRLLFAHRSDEVQEPDTWGTWGGAIDEGESPISTLAREISEEAGYRKAYSIIPLVVFKHSSGFTYYNFLAIVQKEFNPRLNYETQGYAWVEYGHWPRPLHPGAKFLLEKSARDIKRHIRS
jgi:8-oxo-dGTP pyrophosphatase MutT (NUDIX family)